MLITSETRIPTRTDVLFPAVLSASFTVLSIFFVQGYTYGIGDHWLAIPFIKDIANPQLYPGDLLLDQRAYFYTVLWHLLASLYKIGVPLPPLFFGIYVCVLFFTFLGTYALAMSMFRRKDTAALSLFLLLFYQGHLASVEVIQNVLVPRTASLPLILFALSAFLRGRTVRSFQLTGVAFLLHPINALYALILMVVAILTDRLRLDTRTLVIAAGWFVLIASPVLVWMALYRPDSASLLAADPNWVRILRWRSAHHLYPSSWESGLLQLAVLRVALFLFTWRRTASSPQHATVVRFTLCAFLLMLTGVVFVEFYPITLVLQMQFFRVFGLLVFFILIYYANYLLSEIESGSWWRALLAALLGFALFYDPSVPYTLKIRTIIFACMALSAACWMLVKTLPAQRPTLLSSAVFPLLIIVSTASVYYTGHGAPPTFHLTHSEKGEGWADLQQWAVANTTNTTAFIIAPRDRGFRAGSERSIYADWKDGTMAFVNPDYAYEWARRMGRLGLRSGSFPDQRFQRLTERDFVRIAAEMGDRDVLLVRDQRSAPLRFPVVYKNEDYVVYRVKSSLTEHTI